MQGDNGRWILFETGVGAFFEPKLRERFGVQEPRHVLLDNLGRLGLRHTDIDVVVREMPRIFPQKALFTLRVRFMLSCD